MADVEMSPGSGQTVATVTESNTVDSPQTETTSLFDTDSGQHFQADTTPEVVEKPPIEVKQPEPEQEDELAHKETDSEGVKHWKTRAKTEREERAALEKQYQERIGKLQPYETYAGVEDFHTNLDKIANPNDVLVKIRPDTNDPNQYSERLTAEREIYEATRAMMPPANFAALRQHAARTFLENPTQDGTLSINEANANVFIQDYVSDKMNFGQLQQIAKAFEAGDLDYLFDSEAYTPSELSEAEQKAKMYEERENTRIQQERDNARKEMEALAVTEYQNLYKPANEIFQNTPANFGFKIEPNDTPEVQSVKQEANLVYTSVCRMLMQMEREEATKQGRKTQDDHIRAWMGLDENDKLAGEFDKNQIARIQAQFGGDIAARAKQTAQRVAKWVSEKIVTPQIQGLKAEGTKSNGAPKELGNFGSNGIGESSGNDYQTEFNELLAKGFTKEDARLQIANKVLADRERKRNAAY